jgi:hypothetical protein
MVQETNWASRAPAIGEWKPDVVALQEVYRWSTVTKMTEVEVVHDFLSTQLDALDETGEPYVSPVRAWGVSVELPTEPGPDLRFEDSVAGVRCWSTPAEAQSEP